VRNRGIRLRLLAACLALAAGIAAAVIAVQLVRTALADADPASDVLLGASVFYPYTPQVSAPVERALGAEVAAAAKHGFPIKVALIASPVDLGALPSMFGKPQQYADFLDQEISFSGKQKLLVVMPDGFGVQGVGPAATGAAASLGKSPGASTDALARAATVAVARLSAAAGHPIGSVGQVPGAPGGAASGGGSGSSPLVPLVIVIVVAVAAAGAVIAVRRRSSR
jgi:hypothetical protein